MRLKEFKVTNFRNVIDSGWINVSSVSSFVGQNEAGKSNLFEALVMLNPYDDRDGYRVEEDWPMDDWPGRKTSEGTLVAEARFQLKENDVISLNLQISENYEPDEDADDDGTEVPVIKFHDELLLRLSRAYGEATHFQLEGLTEFEVSSDLLREWALTHAPKFVLINDYGLSNTQMELTQLKRKKDSHNFSDLTPDEQTILIVLELAEIDIDQIVDDSANQDGRTNRTLDTISASAHLSQQFQKLWSQKQVSFEIRIDGDTLNIFAKDEGSPMPIRLKRRSTGFRWYTSFAWKFTHASSGQYENCVLLLEEPGIHLHYQGQRDLIQTFENLASENDVLYTTHLSSMVDHANPERVHIVENRNHHAIVKHGVVSSQKAPMAVIEASLGLTPSLGGMLGNRKILIVEGGIDSVVLSKLSGLLNSAGKPFLSDQIYIWIAETASKTPMFAAFAIGQKWDAALLLDNDDAGEKAKQKISDIYLKDIADDVNFNILMMGKAAGISKTDVEVEDIFPTKTYLEWVNKAYSVNIQESDLPLDGSTAIVDRVSSVLKAKFSRKLDKKVILAQMFESFDTWKTIDDLPEGVADSAIQLFEKINHALDCN